MTLPIWFELFIFFGFWIFMLGFFAVIIGFMVFWLKLTPKSARVVRHAIRNKLPIIATENDPGNVTFRFPYEITPEGIMKVKDGTEELRFAVPRRSKEMEGSMESLMSKRSVLEGSPMWFGYDGKGVVTNLKTLANIEYAPKLPNGGEQEEKSSNPKGIEGEVWVGEDKQVRVFWPVSLRILKEAFAKSWNQSQIRALELKADMSGMLKGRKYFGGGLKEYMPFMLMALLVLAIIVLGALLLG